MTSPGPSLPRRLGQALLCVACFLVAFAAVCGALARITPFPDVSAITPKMKFFESQYSDADTIFVGSSRVFHQIIPLQFDAATAAAGHPTKAFNFGQDGTWPPESFFVLRQILKLHAPRLKYVFIELTKMDGLLRDNTDETAQARYWHDRHHTALAEEAVLHLPTPLSAKASMIWRHEVLWLKRFTNYGSGSPMIRDALWPDKGRDNPPGWTQRAGFRPEAKKQLTGFELDHFTRSLTRVREELTQQRAPLPEDVRRELHSLIAEVRQKGAEPVFFISPGLNGSFNFSDVPDGARLISFCRPDLYPELYNPAYYFDYVHLNPTGAEIYTDIVAKKFVEMFPGRP